MKPCVWVQAGAFLCVLACLPMADAQYARTLEALTRRPSEAAPSENVGRFFGSGARSSPLTTTRGENVPLMNQRSLPFRGEARGAHSRVMPGAQAGSMPGRGPGGVGGGKAGEGMEVFRNRTSEIGMITGLTASQNLELPRPGAPAGYVPGLSACEYTPRRETTRFQDILGLTPSGPAPDEPLLGTTAERLNRHTDELAAQAESAALALFKQATAEMRDVRTGRFENCTDCPDRMARAVQRLTMVSDLTPDSGLPLLLMAHVALEQERPLQAVAKLVEALRRERDLLSRATDGFAGYFGDADTAGGKSEFLEAQMRRYVHIGEYNPNSPVAQALQAYCAWRLGDRDAARAALSQVELLVRSSAADDNELLNFTATLRSALH
jgi:hypothetical protein